MRDKGHWKFNADFTFVHNMRVKIILCRDQEMFCNANKVIG